MIENPNATLRRHNSLPCNTRADVIRYTRSRCSSLSLKSNPYVGWFRHSPPITSHRHTTVERVTELTLDVRGSRSPYVGWFRHAPSTNCVIDKSLLSNHSFLAEYLKRELPLFLSSIPGLDCKSGMRRLEDLICSGHLYGGSPGALTKKDDLASVTRKVLNAVGCWLFQEDDVVLHHNKVWEAALESSRLNEEVDSIVSEEDSVSDSSCSDDDSSLDDYDTMPFRATSERESNTCSSFMISSQAEAHHAHNRMSQMHSVGQKDWESARPTEYGRLDYDISQMDIVRMTRNASLHLDVESILRLPTMTYRSPLTTTRIPDDEEQSWLGMDCNSDSSSKPEEWSWMLVKEEETGQADARKRPDQKKEMKSKRLDNKGFPTDPEKDVCVICMEHFVDGDRLRLLPCGHSFHIGCIDQWLSGSHSFEGCYTAGCPTCKKRPCQDESNLASSTVPSWAFARIGDALARQDSSLVAT